MTTKELREESCKIMDMSTAEIIEYLERYGAEHDLPNKIRVMIDTLKIRLESSEGEEIELPWEELEDCVDLDLEGISAMQKLSAVHAYSTGMADASATIAEFTRRITIPDELLEDEEDEEDEES